jgi:hypothetical protein
MGKKRGDHTSTTDFEVEGIEEAYKPAGGVAPGQPWKPKELPKLQVEKPPQFQDPVEHTARIWILERRARGWFAKLRRWLVGKSRR